jgi:hypothetical protein
MKAMQRVPVLRGGQPGDLAANGVGAIEFSCAGASPRPKIAPNRPRIRGMSDLDSNLDVKAAVLRGEIPGASYQ